ncbi:MAG TPA: DUF2914 domain-containing protein [Candidatus Paceibacterota bacterium]|nr:DUF2914 domain-containing protein [Candidatus Paceibacterota bacterium]
MRFSSPFRSLVDLWNRYERPLAAASLTIGFIFDLFIAKRPDSVFDNLLLLSYLFIAGSLIIILNLRQTRRTTDIVNAPPIFLLLILQFCFGGLSSNLLVLYGKSGTLAGSTLFLLILAAMLIGNEFLKTRYEQLRFNIAVYYLLLLTYAIIAVPTFILHSVGTWVFIISGLISLVVMIPFLVLLRYVLRRGTQEKQLLMEARVIIVAIFLGFNALYFLQIIPPVPLSLKGIGVYHSLTRLPAPAGGTDSIYSGAYEPAPWYVFWRDTSNTYTLTADNKASCFSSVFAPTSLSAPIYHTWERYDQEAGKWVVMSRISFPINGGRDEGYRGFTVSKVTPGKWRCDIETSNGSLIGRISFAVVESSSTPQIATKDL